MRNLIMFAVPLDASGEEIEAAHAAIDSYFNTTPVVPTADNTSADETQTATVASDGTLDVNGLPWDERIHSSNHKFDGKGNWWRKRGVDEKLVKKVEAELRATLAATPPTAAIVPPTAAATPSLPPMPGTGPSLPAAPQLETTYSKLVKLIAENTPPITDDWLNQVMLYFGIAGGSLQNAAHASAELQQKIYDYIVNALKG